MHKISDCYKLSLSKIDSTLTLNSRSYGGQDVKTATTKALSLKTSSLDLRVEASGLEFDMQGLLGLPECRVK